MQYPLLDVFLSMMWFFIWILWIFLLVRIIMDIFRSHDLGGLGKTGWLIFVVFLPFLGVFVYLIARGGKMTDREVRQAQAQEEAYRSYVREVAHDGGGGTADELAKLADLRDRGVISQEEFEKGKEKALSAKAA
jgi:phospholipase D-like protein/putative oligomerization/nucleic acid binding protein